MLGVLGATEFVVGGTSASNTDADFYRLTLTATSNLHLSLAWTGSANFGLAMLDTLLNVQHVQDTGGNPEQMSHNGFTPGDYVFRVTSSSAASTPYTLTIGKH